MGLLILPMLIGTAVLFIIAARFLYIVIKFKTLKVTSIIYGFLLSLALYSLLLSSWLITGEMYALGPYFSIPVVVFLIPFLVSLRFKKEHPMKTILLFSIIVSGLISLFSSHLILAFVEHFGISMFH